MGIGEIWRVKSEPVPVFVKLPSSQYGRVGGQMGSRRASRSGRVLLAVIDLQKHVKLKMCYVLGRKDESYLSSKNQLDLVRDFNWEWIKEIGYKI